MYFMAQMIPETIPATASQGEKLLFEVLQSGLPDDFICWYEPKVQDLYPDFIILGPSFGLLILEVKGWYANRIERANNDYFDIRWTRDGITKVETHRNPLRQAHGYFASAADKLKGYPLLCNLDGNYQGRLCFPIGVGAIMSNITEAQAHTENIYGLLEKPAIAYRDEVLSWPTLTSDQLIQRLKAMFKVDFAFSPLTADQIDTVKGVLHPETAIKEVKIAPEDADNQLPVGATKIVTVDIDIERLARSMKGGHRLLSGVAGSGKTQLLLSRAKILANRLLEHRILILCFNITLAAQLRSQLHEDTRNLQYRERIEVMHFHDWARAVIDYLPNPREFSNNEAYDQALGEHVLKILQASPPAQRWDSVLVDEAHTFSRHWFAGCVAALKAPVNGDLLIVSDGSQSLYKRRKFTWKEVGIKAQGRSRRLTHNHRNTREILDAAWSVLAPVYDGNADATFPAVEPEVALRHGPTPTLHVAGSGVKAVNAAVRRVSTLCESGYSPSDIAILYRWKSRKEAAAFE
ncbi:MAG: NERD domain-containing protein, partial [Cyanobacteria bacterium J06648_11]